MRGYMCSNMLIGYLTVKMGHGLQETETLGTFKTVLFGGTVSAPLTALALPLGRETKGRYRSNELLCMWAGSHKCNTVLYFPLTYMKWFYGRWRQKSFRVCKEVRAASSSLVQ